MISVYPVLPIAIISLILYMLTWLLAHMSVIKKRLHLKIWNVVLLVTFLTTAILGLILAIQVNYKLSIPGIKKMLIWHVDFGIGMTMTGIFHLLWNWLFYAKLFHRSSEKIIPRKDTTSENNTITDTSPGFLQIMPVMALGFCTVITQIVLMREFIAVFNGNELTTGMILTSWMILTAAGAWAGRSSGRQRLTTGSKFFLLLAMGILPIVLVFLLNYLKNIVFVHGIAIGPLSILAGTLVILTPFCIISGYFFSFYIHYCRFHHIQLPVARLYAWESTGSIAGGVVISFILLYFLSNMQILSILLLVMILINLAGVIKENHHNKFKRIIIIILIFLIVPLSFIFKADLFVKQFLYPNQEICYTNETLYGHLTVTHTAGQYNFYENNVLLFTSESFIAHEEKAHYAMVQHKDPRDVLLLSGGITGTIDEILKYKIKSIDYVELNPWLLKTAEMYSDLPDDKRVNTIIDDGRRYVKSGQKTYDVIIMDIPDPQTVQLNRYYTIEFFMELKAIMNKDAVGSLNIPAISNYMNESEIEVNSIIYKSLSSVFDHVLIITGENNYYLFSNHTLNIHIPSLIEEKNIESNYVNSYYLDESSMYERSEYIRGNLKEDAPVNTDFKPVAYFRTVLQWLNKYDKNNIMLYTGLIVLVFVSILIIRLHPVNLCMFTAGFSGSTVEIILLIAIQILYGYVYYMISIIITLFMAGLALGVFIGQKVISNYSISGMKKLIFTMMLFLFLTGSILIILKNTSLPVILLQIIIGLLMIISAGITGLIFLYASKLRPDLPSMGAGIYSLDLLGSATGAFLSTIFIIPVLGLISTAMVLAALAAITWSVLLIKAHKY